MMRVLALFSDVNVAVSLPGDSSHVTQKHDITCHRLCSELGPCVTLGHSDRQAPHRVLFPEPTPSPQGWQRDFPTESEGVWCFAGCPVSVLSQHLRGTPQVSAMVLTGLILAFLVGCLYLALV